MLAVGTYLRTLREAQDIAARGWPLRWGRTGRRSSVSRPGTRTRGSLLRLDRRRRPRLGRRRAAPAMDDTATADTGRKLAERVLSHEQTASIWALADTDPKRAALVRRIPADDRRPRGYSALAGVS